MNPKKAFDDQKRHADDRGIPFLFTYTEWLELWLMSGRWEQRGKKAGQYVMARHNDVGAYTPRNCKIITVEENQAERWEGKALNDEEAAEITSLYRNTRLPQWKIGEMFGIGQSQVSRIVNGNRRNK